MKGEFIVIDGPDGCGKTTQARRLADYLRHKGLKVRRIREPGSTVLGEKIRRILLNPINKKMSIRTELFLYMACRAQLVDEIIKPAFKRGEIVVSERFLSSTIVYQGWAGQVGKDEVKSMGRVATDNIQPELTIILDVRPEEGLRRIKGKLDRIEARMLSYHKKVREGFLALARENPRRVKVINADRSVNEVQQDIRKVVANVI